MLSVSPELTLLRIDPLLTGLFALIFLASAVYSSVVPQGGRRWWGLAALLAVLVLAALQFEAALPRVILLDLAALTAVALVWTSGTKDAPKAGRLYLLMAALGMVCAAVGLYLAESGPSPLAGGLLILGFALKLALVPLYFWLPGIATAAAPMTTAMIVATLDMAEFGELFSLRQSAPWVFTDHWTLWMILALLSMFGGALLALAQRDIKRMLAFSTIDDMGYLLLGVLIGSNTSMMGAVFGLVSHALCKTLLFGAVGMAERVIQEPLTLDCKGLSSRFPVSSAMFITGSLGMLGVPPLVGFLGRWRLYLSGVETGGLTLGIAMVVATGLALFYYVRAIHTVWLGQAPGRADPEKISYEPPLAAGVLIVLAAITLALGLFPALLQGLLG
jgi:multicomponent Na+:H+ antiporter subunit D